MPSERAAARTPSRQTSPAASTRAPGPSAAAAPRARAPAPSGPPVLRLVTGARSDARVRDERLDDLLASPGPGEPLPEAVRRRLESSLRVDLAPVRVHADKRTRGIVDGLRARAFTWGRRIFLGTGELPTDLQLMAHESAHVVQQRGRPVVQMSTGVPSTSMLEREADRASSAVQRNEPAVVTGRTGGPLIQRAERLGTIEQGPQAEEESSWSLDLLWRALGAKAARIREIVRVGMIPYLRNQIVAAFRGLVDRLLAPVRPLHAAMAFVRSEFTKLVGLMREVAGQLAKNDCSAITLGIERVKEVADSVLTVIKDKIEGAWTTVKDFFGGLWDKFGAPIWETLKDIGGELWDNIKQFGAFLWESTATIREDLRSAWSWLKDKLGIGEGEEGQDGLLQWVQRKAATAWNEIKPIVEPYKKQLLIVGGIVLLFTPAGPFVAFFAGVQAFRLAVQWFKDNAQKKNAVVDQRSFVQRTLIPGVMKAVNAVTSGLRSAVAAISLKLGGIVGGLAETVGGLQASLFSFVASAVAWIQEQVQALVTWASTQLAALSDWLSTALDKLKTFLQPVLDFLREVGGVVVDIMTLPVVIAGKLWKLIPACIRDPFVNFLIEQVIKKIPLFKTVTETIPNIWTRIKTAATTVISKIFKDGDLPGALVEVLRLVLDALGIPIQLITGIFDKASALIDMVIEDPARFLMNMLAVAKAGFINFGDNILKHLIGGLKDWLFGALKEGGVTPPDDFSLKSVFTFIVQLLGITVELVFQRLEKKFGAEKIKPFRRLYSALSAIWSWLGTLMEGGPDAVWARLGEKLGNLWEGVLSAVQGYILTQVAKKAAASLAQLGAAPVGTVVKAIGLIYDAIVAVKKYTVELLEILNAVLDMGTDIAHGAIAGGAALIESLLERALGVAIGFLAQFAGLGDLSTRIRETVEDLREKVVLAIDWLIEKVSKAIESLIGMVKAGVGKLVKWWTSKRPVKQGDEEHTLYFDGDGETAELMFASFVPKALPEVVAEAKKDPKNKNNPRKAALAAIDKELGRIATLKKKKPKDTEVDQVNADIVTAFETIADRLAELGLVMGSENNPFLIEWPKPDVDHYPPIYFVGLTSDRADQTVLANQHSTGGKTPAGEKITKYLPTEDEALPGSSTKIGVLGQYQLRLGSVVGPLTQAGTPGGSVLNDLLRPYGFRPSLEYKDADHLQEVQFSGPNQRINMWPLNASTNRGGGSALAQKNVDTDGDGQPDTDIPALKDDAQKNNKKYFFRIVKVNNSAAV